MVYAILQPLKCQNPFKSGGTNMKFDFDKVIDRRGTGSLKWDVPENELPMWVADMDFQTAPCIRRHWQPG